MTTSDLVWRSEWAVTAISNLIVLGIAIESYRRCRRRSVMLIAIGAAVGFLYIVLSWMAQTTSELFWNVMSLANILGALFWIAGVYLLLTEVSRGDKAGAEPCRTPAPPNGGPAASVDNPNAPGGPPSVS